MLSETELDRLAELEAKATEGPWAWLNAEDEFDEPTALGGKSLPVIDLHDRYDGYAECGEDLRMDITEADRNFIAESRNAIPALIEQARYALRAKAVVEAARNIHDALDALNELEAKLC